MAARRSGDLWACVKALRSACTSPQVAGAGWAPAIAIARAIGDDGSALALAERCFRETSGSPAAAYLLAEVYTDRGDARRAVGLMQSAASRGKLTAEAQFRFSRMLMIAGEIDAAHDLARSLLKEYPDSPTLWERIAKTRTFSKLDADFERMRRLLERIPESDFASLSALASALAKATIEVGDDTLADKYLKLRGKATLGQSLYDLNSIERATADIESWVSSAPTESKQTAQSESGLVFILGPARSGTTLVDQILSRHSKVIGGGERKHLWIASNMLGDCSSVSIEARLRSGGPPDVWREIGDRYKSLCHDNQPVAGWFTDKLLSNIYRVRVIERALPSAKIVFVRRGALATAWSCWRAQFDLESAWNATPDGIAKYISCYWRAMDAWSQRYPDRVHTIEYERLVREPDLEIGKLLSFCELPDEVATRSPHLSARSAATLSFEQVRRPIHRDGIDSARHFPVASADLRRALDMLDVPQ